MVEVFKTDVFEQERSRDLIENLLRKFPDFKINFDLEDCDRILRIEGEFINPEGIIFLLQKEGHYCEVL